MPLILALPACAVTFYVCIAIGGLVLVANNLPTFAASLRATVEFEGAKTLRTVFETALAAQGTSSADLASYISDRAPLCYRDPSNVAADIQDGFFRTAILTTLDKLPTSQSFQESHFGEIVGRLFAEEVIGLTTLYSKLSLLTSENANPNKMDLVMYDPNSEPLEIWLGEVKSSMKLCEDGKPARHDKSCFPDVFDSLREYSESDLSFDLGAIRDRLGQFPPGEAQRIRNALLPYSSTPITYFAVTVIDKTTMAKDEYKVLATRKSKKEFDVDVVGIEDIQSIGNSVYGVLEKIRKAACLT